ncbi:MAG: 30S ribosomal protein S2 [Candidatus Omnitrophota bacterium]|nr:30S ribosomal protein S2 [Candidatus Omnitrophota bacterium]MDZ4241666.1 30S ribosomal protein S2 [Candidatus Omnitrophota bacterium]
MTEELLKTLLECGVHFGHQTRRWNPKMKRFIFGERSGIYIIDLEKTIEHLNIARDFVRGVAAKGGTVLFVGTKKQAQDVIAAEAKRCEMHFINNRWMGGLLTNYQTIRKSLEKLVSIEKLEADGVLLNLTKKEVAKINKERDKLLRDLGGIREMKTLPQVIFIVDSKKEEIAVLEANRLKIPVIGLIDTNCDPDLIQYPVPGNDDALKSIRQITVMIADSVLEGRREFMTAEAIKSKDAVPAAKGAAPQEGPSDATAKQDEPNGVVR